MRTAERTRGSLSGPAILAAALVAITLGGLVGLLVAGRQESHDSAAALLAADRLERLLSELEQSQLGYVATGDESALSPWHAARAALPRQAEVLQRLARAAGPAQVRRAREIILAETAYLREHAEPLMEIARRDRGIARSLVRRAEGRRRLEEIRRRLDRFADAQRRLVQVRERGAFPATRRLIATTAGVSGSALLMFLVVGFVTRGHGTGPLAVLTRPARRRLRPDAAETLPGVVTLAAETSEHAAEAAARMMGQALDADYAMICRYEPDGTAVATGCWSAPGTPAAMPPAGGRWPVREDPVAAAVLATGRPARRRGRAVGGWPAANGIRRVAGCPIRAGDRLWGMAAVFSRGRGHWPAEAEESLKGFAGLVGVSVVNARQRAELTASRIRLVEAADTTRRRIERDLHERIQQRLVTVGLELRAAERTVPPGTDGLRERISGAARHVTEIIESLQDIARGLHPAFLLRGGLEPSLRALARRSALPVELEFHGERPPSPTVAITLYHVASEALANAAQHGHASAVRIRLDQEDRVRLRVDDDGVGGARPYPGSALVHLRDRTEALGGELVIESPPGSGTSIRVTMPAEPPPHA